MAQSGNSGDGKSAPFSNNGKPTNQGTTASGGKDLLTDPKGGADTSGGVDLLAGASRPQVKKADPPGLPNKESIPAGGKIPLSPPGAASKSQAVGSASGGVKGVNSTPFKGLK